MVMPLRWHEPFGLVAVESLASGTPVIAWRMGALPEIIEDGVSGYLVDDVGEAVDSVELIGEPGSRRLPNHCRSSVHRHCHGRQLLRGVSATVGYDICERT